jgi:hypothetical protein
MYQLRTFLPHSSLLPLVINHHETAVNTIVDVSATTFLFSLSLSLSCNIFFRYGSAKKKQHNRIGKGGKERQRDERDVYCQME